jgi:predicted alpha/beta superfamily hydrolase
MSGRNDIEVTSGGAAAFLNFILKELIPFIEANYRASPTDRALLGYSHGGLFTLYALFHAPGAFQRYCAGSPSLNWDNGILFACEADFPRQHKDLAAKLFMSCGGSEGAEMIKNMEQMAGQLRSRKYPSLRLATHVFADESHSSGYAGTISRALREIYK